MIVKIVILMATLFLLLIFLPILSVFIIKSRQERKMEKDDLIFLITGCQPSVSMMYELDEFGEYDTLNKLWFWKLENLEKQPLKSLIILYASLKSNKKGENELCQKRKLKLLN